MHQLQQNYCVFEARDNHFHFNNKMLNLNTKSARKTSVLADF